MAQKVKVQCCYWGPVWSEKVGWWISNRLGWLLELLTELITHTLFEPLQLYQKQSLDSSAGYIPYGYNRTSLMTTFWLHSCYILAIFWQHFGYILATFLLHFGYILATFWLNFDFSSATFWLHSSYILVTFWLHFGYILATFWLHSGYILASFFLNFG